MVGSCGCLIGKCFGGLQRRCDIFVSWWFFLEIWSVAKLRSWHSHSALILEVLGPTFVLLVYTFSGKPLSRPVFSAQWAVFRSTVAVGRLSAHTCWCCHPACHAREAEQMGPLALLVLLGCMWQMQADGDDCFTEWKRKHLLDLLS